jgi:hypothetical protein
LKHGKPEQSALFDRRSGLITGPDWPSYIPRCIVNCSDCIGKYIYEFGGCLFYTMRCSCSSCNHPEKGRLKAD